MINKEKHILIKIICNDVLCHSKLTLIIFIAVLISAILVVITTYQTRQFTFNHEQIVLEKNALDIEWRNLILEEQILRDHNRIERIAMRELQMQYVNPLQENIVIIRP